MSCRNRKKRTSWIGVSTLKGGKKFLREHQRHCRRFPKVRLKNRLGLARWLTDPRHPLTARVTVNRVWQSLFGRGLVKTAEDLGSQGSRPLYPAILDSLALQLLETKWDLKRLIRSIVLSKTYCQRSMADDKTLADDPDNEWLARGSRFRLPAEMIRDNALAAAGL